jgi:hypothetical protein
VSMEALVVVQKHCHAKDLTSKDDAPGGVLENRGRAETTSGST